MLDSNGETIITPDYEYSDDEDDVVVDNMVKLIEERFHFTPACIIGGVSRQDVSRMRE